jgi:hypothetical protein
MIGGFAVIDSANYIKNWTAEVKRKKYVSLTRKIYSDENNLPGTLLYSATSPVPQNTVLGTAYVSFNPPIALGNGTYWVSTYGNFDAQSFPTPNNNMNHSWSVTLRQTNTGSPKIGQQWVLRENRSKLS